jgi:DNA-directed RNA polymerase specialized sigma subunit
MNKELARAIVTECSTFNILIDPKVVRQRFNLSTTSTYAYIHRIGLVPLSSRTIEIISLLLYTSHTQKYVALTLGISQQYVSQVYCRYKSLILLIREHFSYLC